MFPVVLKVCVDVRSQYMHSLNHKAYSCFTDKKGPVYAVEWSPNSTEFCVVYGCILQVYEGNRVVVLLPASRCIPELISC